MHKMQSNAAAPLPTCGPPFPPPPPPAPRCLCVAGCMTCKRGEAHHEGGSPPTILLRGTMNSRSWARLPYSVGSWPVRPPARLFSTTNDVSWARLPYSGGSEPVTAVPIVTYRERSWTRAVSTVTGGGTAQRQNSGGWRLTWFR